MPDQVGLITYVDRFGGDLKGLRMLLNGACSTAGSVGRFAVDTALATADHRHIRHAAVVAATA